VKVFSYLERHTSQNDPDRRDEIASHQRMENNRQALIRTDPDAARILTVDFTQVLDNPANSRRIAEIVTDYKDAKLRQGRDDLYRALFTGIEA
jgi:phosphatidylethanolamine-binding protein (PEBP) family uncharacterized protein